MSKKEKINNLLNELIKKDYESFVKYLISHKFNINSKNEKGESLLHLCVKYGLIEKYYVLMGLNVRTDILTDKGLSILHYACKYSKDFYLTLEIAKIINPLIKDNQGNTALHYCDEEKNIIYFINWSKLNQIDISNLKNNENETIIDYAIKNNYKNQNLWKSLLEV